MKTGNKAFRHKNNKIEKVGEVVYDEYYDFIQYDEVLQKNVTRLILIKNYVCNAFYMCGFVYIKYVDYWMYNIFYGVKNMFNIKANSQRVEPGDIFVAIKGHTVDGHKSLKMQLKEALRF